MKSSETFTRRTRRLTLIARCFALAIAAAPLGCTLDGEIEGDEGDLIPQGEDQSLTRIEATEGLLAVFTEADATVRSGGFSNQNFGGSRALVADRFDNGSERQAYLRFSVPAPAQWTRATLQLYVTNGTREGAVFFLSSSNERDEAKITWNLRPTLSSVALGGMTSANTGTWFELDITAYARAEGKLTIGLVGVGADGVSFASRESTRKPRIVFELVQQNQDGGMQTRDAGQSADGGRVDDAGQPDGGAVRDAGTVDAGTPPRDGGTSGGGPLDECLNPKAGWLYCNSFETPKPWDGNTTNPIVVSTAGPSGQAGNHAMQLRTPAGQSGGYGVWKSLPASDRLYARWYVQWEPGHKLSAPHHGPGGLGADTAWYTGRSGIRPNGDEYFSAGIESGTSPPYPLYSYTYYRGMYQDCGDPNGRCWGDSFPCSYGPGYCTRSEDLPRVQQPTLQTGRWYCLEQLIDTGTPVTVESQANGVLDIWLDGVELGPWKKMWWRTVSSLKVNFLWLYLYNHDGTHSAEGMLIDDVVVSTSPIGCR